MDEKLGINLPEKFTDKYFIYSGTESIEEMNENLEVLGLEKARCYYIKLGIAYYAVFSDTFDKEIIVGKDLVFYKKNNRLIQSTIGDANIDYTISCKDVRQITDTLARELNYLFDPIEIYYYPSIKSKEYRLTSNDIRLSNYVVILAVTFASRFYSMYDVELMRNYFVHTDALIGFLKKTKGAVSIDPFTQEIKFKDGSIQPYSFTTVSEERYYGYNSSYMGNGRRRAIISLQNKNQFSPFRKREWPSLTRYQAMYPNDDIFKIVQPDYRDGKHICKWCGSPLDQKKKSYCNVDCRIAFGKNVTLERNALLPYLILCRDKFTCQTCGEDMALVNKHGMKIPIPKLSEIPDKDGKCRSKAEVDHIVAVEDGGSDHQSNLGTKCQNCHKSKHSKKSSVVVKNDIENKSNVILFNSKKKIRLVKYLVVYIFTNKVYIIIEHIH